MLYKTESAHTHEGDGVWPDQWEKMSECEGHVGWNVGRLKMWSNWKNGRVLSSTVMDAVLQQSTYIGMFGVMIGSKL